MPAAAGGLGLPPSEFWAMTPHEFYLLWDAIRPRDPERDLAGTLTPAICAELYELLP